MNIVSFLVLVLGIAFSAYYAKYVKQGSVLETRTTSANKVKAAAKTTKKPMKKQHLSIRAALVAWLVAKLPELHVEVETPQAKKTKKRPMTPIYTQHELDAALDKHCSSIFEAGMTAGFGVGARWVKVSGGKPEFVNRKGEYVAGIRTDIGDFVEVAVLGNDGLSIMNHKVGKLDGYDFIVTKTAMSNFLFAAEQLRSKKEQPKPTTVVHQPISNETPEENDWRPDYEQYAPKSPTQISFISPNGNN